MAYLALKRVKGKYYLYQQESYREGGRVRTRTVSYLGALAPEVGESVQKMSRKAKQAELRSLVYGVRSEVRSIAPVAEKKPTAPLKTAKRLSFPKGFQDNGVSETALYRTAQRYTERLKVLGVEGRQPTQVEVRYGKKDSLHAKSEGYIVEVERLKRPTTKMRKAQFWQHYRQALSYGYLSTIEKEKPELYQQLRRRFESDHQQGLKLLLERSKAEIDPAERVGLSLQMRLWGRVPRSVQKKFNATDVGLGDYSALKDWKQELVWVMSEVQRSGWDGLKENQKKSQARIKSTITRRKTKMQKMTKGQKLLAGLSGKRRRLLREIMAYEKQLRASERLLERYTMTRDLLAFG